MWLPHGWWIEVEGRIKHYAYHAGIENLVKIESPAKFRSAKTASKAAKNALRLLAYYIRDVGWTKFRCHSRIPGTHRAFCGAKVGDSPNLQNYGSEPCGNCYRILESIQCPDEPETDVKKHSWYVSFNSERNPDVNSNGYAQHSKEVHNGRPINSTRRVHCSAQAVHRR